MVSRPISAWRRTLVVSCFLLCAIPVFAQQTGAIIGKVTVADGSALPGVTVEASSAVLPTPRTTSSGANGEYRLPALPPGTYTVRFDLSGMQSVTRTAEVQLSQDTVANAVLGMQSATAEVSVTARVSLVDKESATIASGLSTEELRSLPDRTGLSRPAEVHPGRPVHGGARARPERRRQRTGQRLPVRRRQRVPASVRKSLRRARLPRHRSSHRR